MVLLTLTLCLLPVGAPPALAIPPGPTDYWYDPAKREGADTQEFRADSFAQEAKVEATKTLTISSAEELALFAYEVDNLDIDDNRDIEGTRNPEVDYTDWTIVLAKDIDLSGHYWYPINLPELTFDGNGHTISDLHVKDVGEFNIPGENYPADPAGLFGGLDRTVVRNLILKNPLISPEGDSWPFYPCLGAIAGVGQGAQIRNVVINNPAVEFEISTNFTAFCGGVIGYAYESDATNSAGLYANIINGAEVYKGTISVKALRPQA
jgi:hypothetical protein